MLVPAPTIRFARASDGYRFAARVWEVREPIAHVVCLHGIVSHGGWYLSSCSHLAKEGFHVHMLERRGTAPDSRTGQQRWEGTSSTLAPNSIAL